MKLVITIDDDIYDDYLKQGAALPKYGTAIGSLYEALWNGVPLPEHHGDLIDVNVLRKNIHYVPLAPIFQGDFITYRNVIFADILDMLPTIIEGE